MADRCEHCQIRLDGVTDHDDSCPTMNEKIREESERLSGVVDTLLDACEVMNEAFKGFFLQHNPVAYSAHSLALDKMRAAISKAKGEVYVGRIEFSAILPYPQRHECGCGHDILLHRIDDDPKYPTTCSEPECMCGGFYVRDTQ